MIGTSNANYAVCEDRRMVSEGGSNYPPGQESAPNEHMWRLVEKGLAWPVKYLCADSATPIGRDIERLQGFHWNVRHRGKIWPMVAVASPDLQSTAYEPSTPCREESKGGKAPPQVLNKSEVAGCSPQRYLPGVRMIDHLPRG